MIGKEIQRQIPTKRKRLGLNLVVLNPLGNSTAECEKELPKSNLSQSEEGLDFCCFRFG